MSRMLFKRARQSEIRAEIIKTGIYFNCSPFRMPVISPDDDDGKADDYDDRESLVPMVLQNIKAIARPATRLRPSRLL